MYCGLPQPLLACGYTTPHNYWILHIQALDFDGDGRKELLLDGNPGTVGILKGVEPGSWTSARALIQGGAICGETLSAPTRYDWDHDGKADIILTDASGWMTFWGGTDDPLVYKGARSFTVGGKPFCLKGGDSGSLQGKVERVWGYVKVIAGTWGGRARRAVPPSRRTSVQGGVAEPSGLRAGGFRGRTAPVAPVHGRRR